MGFTSLLLALLAVFPAFTSARALPATSIPTTDYSQYCELEGPLPYNGYNCHWWTDDDYASALKCTCNTQLPGQYELCHFFSQADYGGWEYVSYGQKETCYNLEYPDWNKVAASMALGKDTSSCWVYTQPDCSGPYTVVSNVAKFPNSPSGVTSFQCYGPVPLPPPPPPPDFSTSSSLLPILTPSTSTPIYAPPPPAQSPSSKGGVLVTPTPTPTLSTPVYVPPSPPKSSSSSSSSSKHGGNVSTPTPTPTPTAIYLPPPPPPPSTTPYSPNYGYP